MQFTKRHSPSFTMVRAELGPHEKVRAESGAMAAMTADVSIDAKMEGGLFRGLKRSVLAGESLFITTASAGAAGGWIDLAAALPGDVAIFNVAQPMLIQRGSFLCATEGVDIDTKWGGMKTLFGGEGAFLIRATGAGQVVVSAYGALDRMTLDADEQVIVDTGHMVAFAETVSMRLTKATESLWKSATSGEGLVFEFTGPGEVLIQSRNPADIIRYIAANLPGNRN